MALCFSLPAATVRTGIASSAPPSDARALGPETKHSPCPIQLDEDDRVQVLPEFRHTLELCFTT